MSYRRDLSYTLTTCHVLRLHWSYNNLLGINSSLLNAIIIYFQSFYVTNLKQSQIPKVNVMLALSRIFSVVAGLVLLVDPATSIAIPAASGKISARATYVGGVSVQVACVKQYNSIYMEARRYGDGASDWYCYDTRSEANRGGVDINAACEDEYGPEVYAQNVGGGVFDWGCYLP